ncbi:hypothetical protein MKX03_037821 [Papaver bracteatum]|nr:hypothetical protein MKX03_037821 [Papaver bracteatum]
MATTLRMMKKVSSSILPLANRRTPRYGNYTSAIFTTPLNTSTTSIRSIGTSSSTNLSSQLSRASSVSTHHPTSDPANKESNSDDTLVRNIQSEIDRIEEEFQMVPEAPRGFPFKIEDNADERATIRLTREYQGEQIKVIVCAACGYIRSLDLVVSVRKKTASSLEFDVQADEHGIRRIISWAIKNPNAPDDKGPDFSDLNDGLEEDFLTYLVDRGIKPSITKFLCDYMDNKDEKQKEQILWLKKLKNLIKN